MNISMSPRRHLRRLSGALAATLVFGAAAQAGPSTVASQVKGVYIVEIRVLPKAPEASTDACSGAGVATLATAPGHEVARQGWTVSAEKLIDGYTVISFYSNARPGPGGKCLIENGNVAVYKNDALKALIYGPGIDAGSGKAELVSPVAMAIDAGVADRIQLWDSVGEHGPTAELVIRGNALSVEPLPASESYCGGVAPVPTVYGLPIEQARGQILKAGWSPMPANGLSSHDPARDLVKDGVTEAQGCTGGGTSSCHFSYRQGENLQLDVVANGASHRVISFSVNCAATARGEQKH